MLVSTKTIVIPLPGGEPRSRAAAARTGDSRLPAAFTPTSHSIATPGDAGSVAVRARKIFADNDLTWLLRGMRERRAENSCE